MATNYNASVSREIAVTMAREGLSQQQLALRLGWSPQYLSRRMRGDVAWLVTDLMAVADALGIPAAELISPRAALAAS